MQLKREDESTRRSTIDEPTKERLEIDAELNIDPDRFPGHSSDAWSVLVAKASPIELDRFEDARNASADSSFYDDSR